MTLDELKEEWSRDSTIDEIELGTAAINCSKLHSKYLNFLIHAKALQSKIFFELIKIESLKNKYFRGELTSAELKELGWDQWAFKTLKADIPSLIQSDDDYQKVAKREQYLKLQIYFLESVMGEIKNRNFSIRAAIDFAKMRAGN
jgi:hypothetical protein